MTGSKQSQRSQHSIGNVRAVRNGARVGNSVEVNGIHAISGSGVGHVNHGFLDAGRNSPPSTVTRLSDRFKVGTTDTLKRVKNTLDWDPSVGVQKIARRDPRFDLAPANLTSYDLGGHSSMTGVKSSTNLLAAAAPAPADDEVHSVGSSSAHAIVSSATPVSGSSVSGSVKSRYHNTTNNNNNVMKDSSAVSVASTASEADPANHPCCGFPLPKLFLNPRWLLACLCLSAIVQGMIFTNVVISSIERRFGLQSTQSGIIAGSYDFGSLLAVIPVTYFGGRPGASKPHYIATGMFIMGSGSLLFAAPHFVTDR